MSKAFFFLDEVIGLIIEVIKKMQRYTNREQGYIVASKSKCETLLATLQEHYLRYRELTIDLMGGIYAQLKKVDILL